MSLSVGIVGLPNVGKSTLFKALTKQPIDISNYPFCTIDPNVGIVAIPDSRLAQIHEAMHTPKLTPTVIEFVDIAGLVKNAHQGEGLGNQFLANIREVDAICQVVRNFVDDKITHVENKINPKNDIEIINAELILKDLDTVSKRLEKTKKSSPTDKNAQAQLKILEKIKSQLDQENMANQGFDSPEEKALLKELGLITAKPMIYVFNTSADKLKNATGYSGVSLNLKDESDISELSEEEAKELDMQNSQLDKLIQQCYTSLGLITFYTTGGPESRAWTTPKGSTAPQAGAAIHGDFKDRFIKAEIIAWDKLIEIGSWAKAREAGRLRTEGKQYIVQDGDVIEFKI